MTKIAIIGAGNMGGAIARGLAGGNFQVSVSNHTAPKLEILANLNAGILTTLENDVAAEDAEIVIIAVSPDRCLDVIAEIGPVLAPGALVVTMAPAVTLGDIRLPEGRYAARMMPNTAIAMGCSTTFVTFEEKTPESARAMLLDAMANLGEVYTIEEKQFGAVTALCSCGLAYAFRYVRAAVTGAVALGIKPSDALRYVTSTLHGAVVMLDNSGKAPEDLIDSVTTPGGTTIRGLIAMEQAGFSNAVVQGLLASGHE